MNKAFYPNRNNAQKQMKNTKLRKFARSTKSLQINFILLSNLKILKECESTNSDVSLKDREQCKIIKLTLHKICYRLFLLCFTLNNKFYKTCKFVISFFYKISRATIFLVL